MNTLELMDASKDWPTSIMERFNIDTKGSPKFCCISIVHGQKELFGRYGRYISLYICLLLVFWVWLKVKYSKIVYYFFIKISIGGYWKAKIPFERIELKSDCPGELTNETDNKLDAFFKMNEREDREWNNDTIPVRFICVPSKKSNELMTHLINTSE